MPRYPKEKKRDDHRLPASDERILITLLAPRRGDLWSPAFIESTSVAFPALRRGDQWSPAFARDSSPRLPSSFATPLKRATDGRPYRIKKYRPGKRCAGCYLTCVPNASVKRCRSPVFLKVKATDPAVLFRCTTKPVALYALSGRLVCALRQPLYNLCT